METVEEETKHKRVLPNWFSSAPVLFTVDYTAFALVAVRAHTEAPHQHRSAS